MPIKPWPKKGGWSVILCLRLDDDFGGEVREQQSFRRIRRLLSHIHGHIHNS